ncbi:LysR family transcriptional regulator [Cohnella nanjingensis]|uniref:LysR family transcriptional regulator n=1 Tax=Cohnella nanjingensis TaxID=1387779 RepID=A0A7X0RPC6_9BACL|nr:LysR family transcriptional regulator [Cohnella nanjingensis]MBB6671150.1 LysR family transcriptional regulator [Cohnella nanjingensis]
MALNVHQLHIFYTVAERGSFSAAAQTLHMTQPAVTMQIQALEERYGVKLLQRSAKKLELTDAGRCLLPQARKAIELMRETDDAMARYALQLKGQLKFAASLTIGEYVLPRLLGPFLKRFPELSVSMRIINTTEILEEIEHHGLAFGLVEGRVDGPGLFVEPVMSDELVLVAPADHPFASRTEVTLEEVAAEPMVLRETGSGTRQVMEEELVRHGLAPERLRVVSDFGSTGAVKSAVEAGLGLSFLSVWTLKHEAALGLLKPVRIQGVSFRRQFYAVRQQSADLPLAASALLNDLRGLPDEPS